ncbi:MAG: hypothetical protein ACLQOO_28820, partial [Terriglobia bacterium]
LAVVFSFQFSVLRSYEYIEKADFFRLQVTENRRAKNARFNIFTASQLSVISFQFSISGSAGRWKLKT